MLPERHDRNIILVIKAIRLAKKIKQIELALLMETSTGNFSKYESGKKPYSSSTQRKFAKYFKIKTLELTTLAIFYEKTDFAGLTIYELHVAFDRFLTHHKETSRLALGELHFIFTFLKKEHAGSPEVSKMETGLSKKH